MYCQSCNFLTHSGEMLPKAMTGTRNHVHEAPLPPATAPLDSKLVLSGVGRLQILLHPGDSTSALLSVAGQGSSQFSTAASSEKGAAGLLLGRTATVTIQWSRKTDNAYKLKTVCPWRSTTRRRPIPSSSTSYFLGLTCISPS